MRYIRNVRSDSTTLAVGTALALKLRGLLKDTTGIAISPEPKIDRFNGEAITFLALTHFEIYAERHLDWITLGMDLTLKAYDTLLAHADQTGADVLLLYNPTSYEIYREVLPAHQTDPLSNEISHLQRAVLQKYARERGLGFCDLTESFRQQVRNGVRRLFGYYDGTIGPSKAHKWPGT